MQTSIETPKQLVAALNKYPSLKALTRGEGMTWNAAHRLYRIAKVNGLLAPLKIGRTTRDDMKRPAARPPLAGRIKAQKTRSVALPKGDKIKRYLFTCAQNNTRVHMPFWENLLVLAKHYRAEIHVSRFTYIKSGMGAAGDKTVAIKLKRQTTNGATDAWWDDAVLGTHFSDQRLEIAPGLVWCGEMNIIPTAVRPLSGLESYTGRKSGIFPHVKIALECVASGKNEGTKFNYTTGAATLRNYIARKAGQKAEFHHCYGALLVEVNGDGHWWCRQINADSAGTIHDLDVLVKGGVLTDGNRVEAITWGDVHVAQIDGTVRETAWGSDGMLDALRPRYQFVHDVLDFHARGHHDMKNPHAMFKRHVQGVENVREEVRKVALFFANIEREWCKTVCVDSNHHNHLGRWLREQDGRADPVNAEYWLAMQRIVYSRIRSGKKVNILRDAIHGSDIYQWPYLTKPVNRVRFLDEDESMVLCPDASGGIECGMHGDLGPNGARGNPRTFARMGRKANTGHTHTASIIDGVYTAGTCSILDPDYVRGPSTWSHSHIVTYPNGKRAIVTFWKGKYRA